MTALDVNPTFADISITSHGSSFDWAIFAVMLLYSLSIFLQSHRRPVEARIFHYLTSSILFISAISYFTMASNLGYAAIVVQKVRDFAVTSVVTIVNGGVASDANNAAGITRAIWYARYIGWTLIFPLEILVLLLVTGLPLSSVFITLFWSLVMIITRLIGGLVSTSYKWGYFALSIFATVYLLYMLMGPARQSSLALGQSFNSLYTSTAGFYSFLLILYPVAWGLSEGGNVIHPDSEMVFYGVLDFLSQPVILTMFLLLLAKTPFPTLSFNSNLAGHALANGVAGIAEKGIAPVAGVAGTGLTGPNAVSGYTSHHNAVGATTLGHAAPATQPVVGAAPANTSATTPSTGLTGNQLNTPATGANTTVTGAPATTATAPVI